MSDTGDDDTGAATCASGRVLAGANALALSPNGHTLYVAALKDAGISAFHISADGTLTQLEATEGCITLTGKDNFGNQTCATGRGLERPYGIAISPDGLSLYVTEYPIGNEGGVAVFSLDPPTGVATQLPGTAGCVTVDGKSNGTAGACAIGASLGGANQPTVSPDGTSIYVPSYTGQSLTVFERATAPVCQAASASTAFDRPVTLSLSCSDADGDPLTLSIVSGVSWGRLGRISPSGQVTYTPQRGYVGPDSFTFEATDGTNVSAPAAVELTVKPPPRPVVSTLRQSRRVWREVAQRKHGPPVGTTFSFRLSEKAVVTLTFMRGHRAAGVLIVVRAAGKARVVFKGRLSSGKELQPGRYTVAVRASNPGGSSRPHSLTFTIAQR
jgi:hypothetical protein